MNRLLLALSLWLTAAAAWAQTNVKGTVRDADTEEPIGFASVLYVTPGGDSLGVFTDLDGAFEVSLLAAGTYQFSVNYVGYAMATQPLTVGQDQEVTMEIRLKSTLQAEVEIMADKAVGRQTPVAFSQVDQIQIREELASRDLPTMLNSTPGVYATESGGGAGDSRVSIRGFDQRNVAVLVDGVPVNDMETSRVFWANWDGLGDITLNMQVQRGLGASRLVVPSVGGTINIITKGLESKLGGYVKQEIGNNGALKTSVGFTSGVLPGGWGITLAGTRKVGDGWVDMTWVDAWSYFAKIQKSFGEKHLLSLSVNGAPQAHGQRILRQNIWVYDSSYARSLGADIPVGEPFYNLGRRYNSAWGSAGDYESNIVRDGKLNERVNYFHKPLVNLSHFWNINDRISLNTVAYFSLGMGGGTRLNTTIALDSTGQTNFLPHIESNRTFIDALYSPTETKSSVYILSSVNNHWWVGGISTLTYQIRSYLKFTGGVDLRYYEGQHYQEVYDLLGGDYIVRNDDANQPTGSIEYLPFSVKRVGDKMGFNYDGRVHWYGGFAQFEYKQGPWAAFFTGTFSMTGQQRVDYFKKKDLVLSDTTLLQAVGYGDTLVRGGQTYTNQSPEARFAQTELNWYPGFTAKGGVNRNLGDHHNVFLNAGYMSIAPRFTNVYANTNRMFENIVNQKVISAEVGYGIRYPKWAANINAYYTLWYNRPSDNNPTLNVNGELITYNINGIDAVHRGVELDARFRPWKWLEIEGLLSIGDWYYTSAETVFLLDQNENIIDTVNFDPTGVAVGDAAQFQTGLGVRVSPLKGLYVRGRWTYFDRNFADFSPLTLNEELGTARRQSWQMPAYSLFDVHAGYELKVWKLQLQLTASVINVLDLTYITDATNQITFDASSAIVYIAQGRRWNVGLKVSF